MQSHVTFEQAAESDAETLAALRIEAMRESLERIGRFDLQRARDRFLSGFSPANTQHVLVGGKRVGFFVVKQEANGLLLDHLYIKPGNQNQGVGAAVLADVFAQADRAACCVRVARFEKATQIASMPSTDSRWLSSLNSITTMFVMPPMRSNPFEKTSPGKTGATSHVKPRASHTMLTIHRASESDVQMMHGIQMRAFEEEGRRCGTPEIPPLLEQPDSILNHVTSHLALVAKQGSTIVGCIRGVLEGQICTVRALVVEPSMQGKGIGSRLLRALEAEVRHMERINLTTNTLMEGNVKFYERHGYRVIARTQHMPGVELAHLTKSAAPAA